MSGRVVKMQSKAERLAVTEITPEMAAELLELNQNNRPLSELHVKRIAAQIKAGKWQFNGDTIKIASSNDILDGQHRLWAVIEAKKPIKTVIVRNVDKEAFTTIDTIRKTRTAGDTLATLGQEVYRTVAGSAYQWFLRWQRGIVPVYRAPGNRIENSDIEEAFRDHPRMIEAVIKAKRVHRIGNPAVIGAMYYVIHNRDPDIADRMLEILEEPEKGGLSNPFFKLRAYFLSDKDRRKDPIMTIALIIKAANAAHSGKKLEILVWRNQGKRAEAFPELSF